MAAEEPEETLTKCFSERRVSFGFGFEKPVKNGYQAAHCLKEWLRAIHKP